MIVKLPLPLRSDGQPLARDARGRLILDLSSNPMAVLYGFGKLVQALPEEQLALRARLSGSLSPLNTGIEIQFTDSADPFNGLWCRPEVLANE